MVKLGTGQRGRASCSWGGATRRHVPRGRVPSRCGGSVPDLWGRAGGVHAAVVVCGPPKRLLRGRDQESLVQFIGRRNTAEAVDGVDGGRAAPRSTPSNGSPVVRLPNGPCLRVSTCGARVHNVPTHRTSSVGRGLCRFPPPSRTVGDAALASHAPRALRMLRCWRARVRSSWPPPSPRRVPSPLPQGLRC